MKKYNIAFYTSFGEAHLKLDAENWCSAESVASAIQGWDDDISAFAVSEEKEGGDV